MLHPLRFTILLTAWLGELAPACHASTAPAQMPGPTSTPSRSGAKPGGLATAARAAAPWWYNAVFYEIYPRSFKDANGDGVGDLKGITSKLDYLADLGVDAIWITPFYPSPQVDFGYDISDYEAIDPPYGTLADFDRLLGEAHARNIRVVMDLVLNHTSDKHPFFVASRSSRKNPFRDFYVWHDPVNGGPPNNWVALFEPSAWAFDSVTGQYYYHAFYAEQPDLNWRDPAVERAMFKSVRFWLDRGVDAFRLDAVQMLYEDALLRDNPVQEVAGAGGAPGQARQIPRYTSDLPECHALLQRLRALTDEYAGDRILIGEAYVPKADDLVAYYGPTNNEVQLPFNFLLIQIPKLDANRFREQVDATERALSGRPTNYVLSNHDNRRSWDHFGDGRNDEAIAKMLMLMLLTLRGAPFIYYGEEIGMVTTDPVSREQVRDPIGRRYWPANKGRDGERTPMQWDGGEHAGFTTGNPWLPVPSSASTRNVAAEARDPQSLLNLYKRMIQMRRRSAALHDGAYESVGADPAVFAYLRKGGDETYLVLLNMSGERRPFSLAGIGSGHAAVKVKLSTLNPRVPTATGAIVLAPYEGVLASLSPPP